MAPRAWATILIANAALACLTAFLAPDPMAVGTTADRRGYEYVGAHPLAANCPYNIYCYRVLVPAVLEVVALPPVVRWRVVTVAANVATGVLVAAIVARASASGRSAGVAAGLFASILFQTSFGATFAVFDPFTPDAAVFLGAALLTMAWLRDRPLMALCVACIGVFAKETVALVITAAALGAAIERWRTRPEIREASKTQRYKVWFAAAACAWALLIGFHLAMDRWAGWSEAGSGSADLTGGAWLARWLGDQTLTPAAHAFYLFIPFAFAWIYAALGVRWAPERLRLLALGALFVLPGLIYVQTAERALSTAFFVVVPLAALFLARLPRALGWAAVATNGLLTARVGLSTPVLPPVPYLLALAAIVGAVTILWVLIGSRITSVPLSDPARVISSR